MTKRTKRVVSFVAFAVAAGCGTGVENSAFEIGPWEAIGSSIPYCPPGSAPAPGGTRCNPVPAGVPPTIQWWTMGVGYARQACSEWDDDIGMSPSTIVLPHDSEYLGDSSNYSYKISGGAWGFGPTFKDLKTGVIFHFNHLKPRWADLAKETNGTILLAGSFVGVSGGDTCETGYSCTGAYASYPNVQYACNGSYNCKREDGTWDVAAAQNSTAHHLCLVTTGSNVNQLFGSDPVPTCVTCSANDIQCSSSNYEAACTGGTCAGAGCCCPPSRGAMSGGFFYCCPAGQHYGPLTTGGAGCVPDSPACSANDGQCASYGTGCTDGTCTGKGCCCPTERTCPSGSFIFCCDAGSHCGTLPGGGAGCVADVGIGGGCVPNCSGRNCGPDPNGCVTSCGTCASGWSCSASGTCTPPPPTCPTGSYWYGAGQYCWFQPGMANTAANHLYTCGSAGGLASDLGNCGEGCHGMPPYYNDICYAAYCPTGGYWYGAGLYCGHGPGMSNANPNIVYYCSGAGAKASINQWCSAACVVAPPGVNDHC